MVKLVVYVAKDSPVRHSKRIIHTHWEPDDVVGQMICV